MSTARSGPGTTGYTTPGMQGEALHGTAPPSRASASDQLRPKAPVERDPADQQLFRSMHVGAEYLTALEASLNDKDKVALSRIDQLLLAVQLAAKRPVQLVCAAFMQESTVTVFERFCWRVNSGFVDVAFEPGCPPAEHAIEAMKTPVVLRSTPGDFAVVHSKCTRCGLCCLLRVTGHNDPSAGSLDDVQRLAARVDALHNFNPHDHERRVEALQREHDALKLQLDALRREHDALPPYPSSDIEARFLSFQTTITNTVAEHDKRVRQIEALGQGLLTLVNAGRRVSSAPAPPPPEASPQQPQDSTHLLSNSFQSLFQLGKTDLALASALSAAVAVPTSAAPTSTSQAASILAGLSTHQAPHGSETGTNKRARPNE